MAGGLNYIVDGGPESEMLYSAFQQGEAQIAALQKAVADARVKEGEPLFTSASALVATTRFLYTLLAQTEGIMRRGAARIDDKTKQHIKELREHSTLTEKATEAVYAAAAQEAIKQLGVQSEKVADAKLKLRWVWSGTSALAAFAVAGAMCVGLGIYLDQQYAASEIAEARAQMAAERTQEAETATAITRASRTFGAKRPEMWAHLMSYMDPIQAVQDCISAGRVTTAGDGRRSCTVGMWIDPPSAPPVR